MFKQTVVTDEKVGLEIDGVWYPMEAMTWEAHISTPRRRTIGGRDVVVAKVFHEAFQNRAMVTIKVTHQGISDVFTGLVWSWNLSADGWNVTIVSRDEPDVAWR